VQENLLTLLDAQPVAVRKKLNKLLRRLDRRDARLLLNFLRRVVSIV
jgi:hypothetical protein